MWLDLRHSNHSERVGKVKYVKMNKQTLSKWLSTSVNKPQIRPLVEEVVNNRLLRGEQPCKVEFSGLYFRHNCRCPRDFPPPRDLAPPGPNPKGSRPPCAPPFRDLAPPSQRHISENILVFRPSYQESFWNMVWQFIWQWICASQTQSQCCLIFSKLGVDFLVIVYVNIVLQLRAWFFCVFLILPNLSIVSWVILVSD